MESSSDFQPQSKWVQMLDPQKYFPIADAIFSNLTSADLLILSGVCKGLQGLRSFVDKKVGNVDAHLKRFVNEPTSFRSLMGKHHVAISGSFALNLIEMGKRKVPSLDLFVMDGHDADRVTSYLCENEGYQDVTTQSQTSRIHRMLSRGEEYDMKIRVMRTRRSPIQHILTLSYTTACLNLVTWNKVYSLFPKQTLIQHKCIPLQVLDDGFGARLKELSLQGWTSRDVMWPDFRKNECNQLARLRYVGDSSTLILSLDTRYIQSPRIPDSVLEYSQFDLTKIDSRYHDSQPAIINALAPSARRDFAARHAPFIAQYSVPLDYFLKIQAGEINGPAIRYGYTVADPDWRDFLETRLQRWAWLELYKLEPGNRPFQTVNSFPLTSDITIPPGFSIPPTWDFADDQIPCWYHEWEWQHENKKTTFREAYEELGVLGL